MGICKLERNNPQFRNISLYVLIAIILQFLAGCSSTYRVTDYPSEAKYYDNINSSIKNREFNVITTDSSFTCLEGSIIKDDSIQRMVKIKKISSSNIKGLPDSSKWFTKTVREYIPLTKINQISYTNHWNGVPLGFTSGLVGGAAMGAIFAKSDLIEGEFGTFVGALSGMIVGAIVGYIIGWDNIYQINF